MTLPAILCRNKSELQAFDFVVKMDLWAKFGRVNLHTLASRHLSRFFPP
ncbi:MAG: hypothetical protein ABF887_11455 [Gluconobacter oxydans]